MKRMTVLLMAVVLAVFMCGCKSTPEKPIVVGKSNDGWDEYATDMPSAEQTAETSAASRYAAPDRYENQLTSGNLTISISADIEVPDLSVYPVYILEEMKFTQEMADRIIPILLDGAELYTYDVLDSKRSKSEVEALIAHYKDEIQKAQNDESYLSKYTESPESIEGLQNVLASLEKELKTAPDTVERKLASRQLAFMEEIPMLGILYCSPAYLVTTPWTEEQRAKAIADGNEAIMGVSERPDGERMILSLKNTIFGNGLSFMGELDRRHRFAPSYDENEAKRRAEALIEQVFGCPVELLYCYKNEQENAIVGGTDSYYILEYRPEIPGTKTHEFRWEFVNSAARSEFVPPFEQDRIRIEMDDKSIFRFSRSDCVQVKSIDIPSVELMPWGTVRETIDAMLKVKNPWLYVDDSRDKTIVARKLEIDRIILSYMQVRKDANDTEQYYIPVWDICGRLIYQYADGREYDTTLRDQRINASYAPDTYLTLNAIDLSVISRELGY